jgi:hypothetical protein
VHDTFLHVGTSVPKGLATSDRTEGSMFLALSLLVSDEHALPIFSPSFLLLFSSQCQQYGFQRIVPSLDFMTAKAYYTTRLVADARYSHLISNGDLAPGYFDPQSGKPTPKALQQGRVEVMYYNHKVKFAHKCDAHKC